MMPLEKYVDKYDINVSDLCKRCDISRTAYYNIISGRSSPTIETAVKIREYIKNHVCVYESVTLEYMFTDWEKKYGGMFR